MSKKKKIKIKKKNISQENNSKSQELKNNLKLEKEVNKKEEINDIKSKNKNTVLKEENEANKNQEFLEESKNIQEENKVNKEVQEKEIINKKIDDNESKKNNKKLIIIYICIMVFGAYLITISNKIPNKEEDYGENGTLICFKKGDYPEESIKIDSSYEVVYSGKYVKTAKYYESVEYADYETAEGWQAYIDIGYMEAKNIDYFDAASRIEGTKLINEVFIDYEKIDLEQLKEIDVNTINLIEDEKISLHLIKEKLESEGNTCEVS